MPASALAKSGEVTIGSITDTHDHFQFAGDGTPAQPSLYNREALVILPFQVNARKFVIPYYVMTRDITKLFPSEQYTVTLRGLRPYRIVVHVLDPLTARAEPVSVTRAAGGVLSVHLSAGDYPRLLVVEER